VDEKNSIPVEGGPEGLRFNAVKARGSKPGQVHREQKTGTILLSRSSGGC